MKIKNINVLPRLIKDIFLSDKKKFILAVLCVLFSGVGVVIAPFMLQNIIHKSLLWQLYITKIFYIYTTRGTLKIEETQKF